MQPLRQHQLGSTALEITVLGLGAWAMGGGEWQGGWGPQDDDESVATIHHAIDCGINWIDTAPAYGLGRAEAIVGRALAAVPAADRPLVFTKCGLVWQPGSRTVENSLSPTSIRRECDDSLRRLGREPLDLLQAHWPTWDDTPIEESWATMADLVTEGKVRHIGLSNFGVDDLARCEAVRHVDTFQPELNLIARDAADDRLPWCREHGTGVIVYSPMRSGLLTGAFTHERVASLPEDDWRKHNDDLTEPGVSRNLDLVERLGGIADGLGLTLPELSVAWTTAWTEVDGAIVGARRPAQIDGWIGAGAANLTPRDLDDIADAIEQSGAGNGPPRPAVVGA
jgi:aryl-alcohol dehydrogenase-like predicted oxidoreductase